ncbi:MAG: histidinol phosphatase [Blastocatellia bacterium]
MNSHPLLILILLLSLTGNLFGQSPPQLGPGRKYTSVERMGMEHLAAVHQARRRYEQARRPVRLRTGMTDYRAILHAHAEDAPHTGGTRPEMLKAAQAADVNIILLSDHRRPERDFITDSWRGIHEGVLFIPGAEAEGFLLYPLASLRDKQMPTREAVIAATRAGGGNIFLSHVEEKLDWPTDNLDGLEIYNHHTDVKDEAAFNFWLQGALTNRARLAQIEQALATYPQEVIAAQQDYLAPILKKWDIDTAHRRLTGVAANDCHHNQVFTVTAVDEQTIEVGIITSRPEKRRITSAQVPAVAAMTSGHKPGELIARLDFDPYERSFRYVSTHILTGQLTEATVREALRQGHAYVAHDWLCDPTGFAFVASASDGKPMALMGDEIALRPGLELKAEAPVACHWKLLRNGEVAATGESREITLQVKAAGVYRVEAWLEADGEMRPWLYSNPIYVR